MEKLIDVERNVSNQCNLIDPQLDIRNFELPEIIKSMREMDDRFKFLQKEIKSDTFKNVIKSDDEVKSDVLNYRTPQIFDNQPPEWFIPEMEKFKADIRKEVKGILDEFLQKHSKNQAEEIKPKKSKDVVVERPFGLSKIMNDYIKKRKSKWYMPTMITLCHQEPSKFHMTFDGESVYHVCPKEQFSIDWKLIYMSSYKNTNKYTNMRKIEIKIVDCSKGLSRIDTKYGKIQGEEFKKEKILNLDHMNKACISVIFEAPWEEGEYFIKWNLFENDKLISVLPSSAPFESQIIVSKIFGRNRAQNVSTVTTDVQMDNTDVDTSNAKQGNDENIKDFYGEYLNDNADDNDSDILVIPMPPCFFPNTSVDAVDPVALKIKRQSFDPRPVLEPFFNQVIKSEDENTFNNVHMSQISKKIKKESIDPKPFNEKIGHQVKTSGEASVKNIAEQSNDQSSLKKFEDILRDDLFQTSKINRLRDNKELDKFNSYISRAAQEMDKFRERKLVEIISAEFNNLEISDEKLSDVIGNKSKSADSVQSATPIDFGDYNLDTPSKKTENASSQVATSNMAYDTFINSESNITAEFVENSEQNASTGGFFSNEQSKEEVSSQENHPESQEDRAKNSPPVHILPEGLMNVACSALNTAVNVISHLTPNVPSEQTIKLEKYMKLLYEMGFTDAAKNLATLQKHSLSLEAALVELLN